MGNDAPKVQTSAPTLEQLVTNKKAMEAAKKADARIDKLTADVLPSKEVTDFKDALAHNTKELKYGNQVYKIPAGVDKLIRAMVKHEMEEALAPVRSTRTQLSPPVTTYPKPSDEELVRRIKSSLASWTKQLH